MNLPKLAIERPVFVTCVVILIMVLGYMSYRSLGVDLFPDVSFPFVSVTTPYKGAAPEEIETQISKPLEEQFSTLEGVKKVYSVNQEGFSIVTIQFTLETDGKDAEQRVRDRLTFVRPQLPKDIDEPVIQRLDPSDQPVMIVSMQSSLNPYQAYDLADQTVKPQLSQVDGVGVVDIFGGAKREIRVELDRNKVNAYRISATSVADNIALNGMNVPVGKFETNGQNVLFRSVGEYNDLDRLRHTIVNFLGSDVPITVDKLGQVVDTVEDAQNYSSLNGKPSLFLLIHKQSKANTVAVVDGVFKAMDHINDVLKTHRAPQDFPRARGRPHRANEPGRRPAHHRHRHRADGAGGLLLPGQLPLDPHHHHGPARVPFGRFHPDERHGLHPEPHDAPGALPGGGAPH